MLIALYPSKKDLKANIGRPLAYRETSLFGAEYQRNGTFPVCNRPTVVGHKWREFFAEVTMKDGLIHKVT